MEFLGNMPFLIFNYFWMNRIMACTGFSEECEKYKSTRFSASGLCSVFKNDYLVTDEKAIQSLNTPGRKSVIKAYGET